ncbi:DUF3099 domain-containing protein [Streptomyces triticirhizae]|uniref:DUF3099 domain-containing protein n=1 Tax=Streptomyces triticirhizae TaxID=2483353 RepID=A0A3M2LDV9_9ACTN|nr:DUF3099 domain-containing protein [Streptomyces triticirhizae]RMI34793.1 DUF3099 domain-containing protein [Streptomyces triticirhizae]
MARWRGTGRGRDEDSEVYRITGARQSLDDDVRARQRRYIVAMVVRTVSVLLTALLWNVSLPLAVVTLLLGIALPYIAVVVANAGRENVPSLPSAFVAEAVVPPALPPGQQEAHKRS